MNSRTRLIVMSISAPVIAFAIVGGFLGKVMAREDTYQHLKIFDDAVPEILAHISSTPLASSRLPKTSHNIL